MKTLLTLALGFAVLTPVSAESLNPFISNPSFENLGIASGGWFSYFSADRRGTIGTWFPATDLPNSGLKAYDGKTVAFVRSPDSPNSQTDFIALAQDLNSVTFTPGQTYTLTYAISRRADVPNGSAEFQLRIGSTAPSCATCYNDLFGSTDSITPGQWQLFTVSYTAQAADAGQHPVIYLGNDGSYVAGKGPTEIEFDINQVSPIPEPGTITLFAGGLVLMFVVMSRRRVRAKA